MSFITNEMEAINGKPSFLLSMCGEKPSSYLCASFAFTENTFDTWSPKVWRFIPIPSNSPDTSGVFYDLTQF